jgi:hypothetical protein
MGMIFIHGLNKLIFAKYSSINLLASPPEHFLLWTHLQVSNYLPTLPVRCIFLSSYIFLSYWLLCLLGRNMVWDIS